MPYSGGTCETFPILLNVVIMLDWISCCPPILVRIRETSFATSLCGCEVRSRILGQLDLGLKNRLAFQQMTILYHFNRWIGKFIDPAWKLPNCTLEPQAMIRTYSNSHTQKEWASVQYVRQGHLLDDLCQRWAVWPWKFLNFTSVIWNSGSFSSSHGQTLKWTSLPLTTYWTSN